MVTLCYDGEPEPLKDQRKEPSFFSVLHMPMIAVKLDY